MVHTFTASTQEAEEGGALELKASLGYRVNSKTDNLSYVETPDFKKQPGAGWWHTPLIPALGRQRQANLCEFKASLVPEFRERLPSYRKTLSQKTNKKIQQ